MLASLDQHVFQMVAHRLSWEKSFPNCTWLFMWKSSSESREKVDLEIDFWCKQRKGIPTVKGNPKYGRESQDCWRIKACELPSLTLCGVLLFYQWIPAASTPKRVQIYDLKIYNCFNIIVIVINVKKIISLLSRIFCFLMNPTDTHSLKILIRSWC